MFRRLRLVVCVLGIALLAVPVAFARPEAAQRHTLLQFGDSLAVGTAIYLPAFLRGWQITQSADISRHTDAGPPGIRAFGPALPRIVVVSLGANDSPTAVDWFGRQVRELVRAAGSDRCVIWSTIVRPPYNGVPYSGLNRVLQRLDRRYPNLVVFDWARLAALNPAWFGRDGVHPTATGYRERARAIATLARTAC